MLQPIDVIDLAHGLPKKDDGAVDPFGPERIMCQPANVITTVGIGAVIEGGEQGLWLIPRCGQEGDPVPERMPYAWDTEECICPGSPCSFWAWIWPAETAECEKIPFMPTCVEEAGEESESKDAGPTPACKEGPVPHPPCCPFTGRCPPPPPALQPVVPPAKDTDLPNKDLDFQSRLLKGLQNSQRPQSVDTTEYRPSDASSPNEFRPAPF